jgi:hypothetical protein
MSKPQYHITSLWQLFHLHVGKPDEALASSDLFFPHVVFWPPSPSVALPLLDHYKTQENFRHNDSC